MTSENNIEFFYESGVPGVSSPLQQPTIDDDDENRLMRITSILDIGQTVETTNNATIDKAEEMDGVEKINSENKVEKKRGGYRSYTDEQIAKFFHLKIELCMSTAAAARSTGIIERTAYNMVKRYEADHQNRLPTKMYPARMGPEPILSENHTNHIIKYLEGNPTAVINDVVDSLCTTFENLNDHIKKKCCFTL
jgi:hypothetical protein